MDYDGMSKLEILRDIVDVARGLVDEAAAAVAELEKDEDADISETLSLMEEIAEAFSVLEND